VDGVEADEFSGKMEAEHLLFPLLVDHVTLETARANGNDGTEWLPCPEHVFTALKRSELLNDPLELANVLFAEVSRKAKLTQ
jgi:hypothetical protein